ncbi:MAG: methyltransferase domain-containing protein [Phycisphaerae bacterium]|nr:methyltransferase domain-containing protein [Phycisphaerae bacterium]
MASVESERAVAAGGNVEAAVLRRYKEGARQAEDGLCCPTKYDEESVSFLPREIVEKDYGCGDPSRYVRAGEAVLDLGSGAGKVCYILAQKVGPEGRVIGADFNDEMLALSRKYIDEVADRLGYRNVRFVKCKIQDLALSLDKAQAWLDAHPITEVEHLYEFQAECDRLRRKEPLISDASVDVVVSNCVLNLARPEDKGTLFAEMHRVLRRGGRAVISDIVCDEDPTPSILSDPDLWSGCIAGAMREDVFLEMFERAGFYGIEIVSRQDEPWQTIEGIEFRSMTVQAFKGKEGPCIERNQAVVYKGPWRCVCDDDGHTLYRGQRMAVCDKTFDIMTNPAGPYAGQIVSVAPREDVPLDKAGAFDCNRSVTRHPRETKGLEYRPTVTAKEGSCCGPDCCG